MEVGFPHRTGGGCVTRDPFANITVNFGSIELALVGNKTDTSGAENKHNPRCLKRDSTDEMLHRYATRRLCLRYSATSASTPAHTTHLVAIPSRDFWASPGEPAFWAHHTNIDRVWWMWQMLDPEVRAANVSTAVNGPITIYDLRKPHKTATIFDLQNLGWVAEGHEVTLGELMSTTEGMFCYVYE